MKKLGLALFTLLCAVLITSCSGGSSTEKIMRAIPEDAMLVAVADVNTLLKSAGGSIDGAKVKLPSDIADLADDTDAIDDLNDIIKNGVDPDACAVVVMDIKSHPVIVGMLKDRKKFVEYIEDSGYREKDSENGATYYSKLVYESDYSSDYNDYSYIAVNDSYVYYIDRVWVGSSFKPLKILSRMAENDGESSYADSPMAENITHGNAAGLAIKVPREFRKELRAMGLPSETLDMLDGYICYTAKLSDQDATVDMRLYDEDGKARDISQFNKYADMTATVNPRALSYLGKDEVLAGAITLKNINWDLFFDMLPTSSMSTSDRLMMVAVKEYISKIDGTVAVGLGVTNGIESIFRLNLSDRLTDCLSLTAVVEVKEGKARGILRDIKALMDAQGIPYLPSDNGFSITIPGQDSVYVKNIDDFLILSFSPIDDFGDNPVASNIDFSKHLCAIGLALDSDSQLMRDLNVKNDLLVSLTNFPNEMGCALKVEVKDGKGGILSRLIRIGLDIADQQTRLSRRYDEIYSMYYEPYCIEEEYYSIDDTVAVDSVFVEEVVAE